MTGSAEIHRYFAVDGGAGAPLLSSLGEGGEGFERVDSPRHADVLLVFEPIYRKLLPALLEAARALPRPSRALILGRRRHPHALAEVLAFEEVLPGAVRREVGSAEEVRLLLRELPSRDAVIALERPPLHGPAEMELPSDQEQELSSELLVWSVGPLQRFTAGPLELLLACDGEQVVRVQVERGYAQRRLAESMVHASWEEAVRIARQLDPLAPFASLISYLQAFESLQGRGGSASARPVRQGALALERALNHLCWLERFCALLAADALQDRARSLIQALEWEREALLGSSAEAGWMPWRHPRAPSHRSLAEVRDLADDVLALGVRVERDRFLRARTQGLGRMGRETLEACGISGPVLAAGSQGEGDVRARLLTRIHAAAQDTALASQFLAQGEPEPEPRWDAPYGSTRATVPGPRGDLGLLLESMGDGRPSKVAWVSPSAALLHLVPHLLEGAKVADAEVLIASLDLSMAEVDG